MNRTFLSPLLVALLLVAIAAPACAQQRTISDEQKQALKDRLQAADSNGDGLIDKAEAQARLPRIAKGFDKLDANADGKLSPEEMRAMATEMSERGRNR